HSPFGGGRGDRPRRRPRAPPRRHARHGRLRAVRLPVQHRRAAVPHRPRPRRRCAPQWGLALAAIDPVPRRMRARGRAERLRDGRDHPLRLLAMTDRRRRRANLAILGLVVAGVVLRLLVTRAQGFPSDVGTFMAWAEKLAAVGPSRFYEPGYFSDYPPGFLYVLWALGALFDGDVLRFAVKAISIPADIGIVL